MFTRNALLTLLFFIPFIADAQCGGQLFSVSDTTCPLKDLTITNSDVSENKYEWDFCTGDLHFAPVAANLSIDPGFGSSPEQLKVVKDGNRFYAFLANNGFNFLVRANFGTSLSNTPTYDTLVHNSLINGLTGIDMVKENGKWIGFIVVNSPARIVRAEFDSITDAFPVITDLGVTGLTSPLEIKVIDHYAFVTDLGGYFIRYSFNGNYLNPAVQVNPIINQPTLFGIDVVYDCASASYYAAVASVGNGGVAIYNFGNDLSSAPTALPFISFAASPRGISLAYENKEWFMATTTNNDHFVLSSFGNSLNSTPVTLTDTAFSGGLVSSFSCQMIKDSSIWHCFALNVSNPNLLSHFYFPDNSCPVSAVWSEQNIPTGINYNASGYYSFDVTVVDSNNVQRIYTDSVLITILPPEAQFTNGPTCANSPVQFTDVSTICYGSITSWKWEFDNGNFLFTQNPSYSFATPGMHAVTLTVYTATNDSSTFTDSVNIVPYPVADFSFVNNICSNTPVLFNDLSNAINDSVTNWNWSFGDTGSSSTQNPSYIYSNGGNYTVQLIATNSNGCADTSTQPITILSSPVAAFTYSHTCTGSNTIFNNLTDSSGLVSVTYVWDFGDTTSSSQVAPVHSYNNTGSYSAVLIASGSNSCNDTLASTVIVTDAPIPNFTASTALACTGNAVTFDDVSFSGSDSVIFRRWNFGDNSADDSLETVNHIYAASGTYTVTLTIATPSYCDTTIQKNITVVQSPAASFTAVSSCFGIPADFTNTTVPAAGDPVTIYHWAFGDSTFSQAFDTTHIYAQTGTYNVTLIAISQAGCIDSITLTANSYELPQADFNNYPLLCTDTIASFIDLSSITSDTIMQWSWSFGDGNTSSDQNPVNIYTTPGTKVVTLVTTSNHGCTDQHAEIITIHQSPSPQITYTPTCLGSTTCFTAADGNTPPNAVTAWQWNFGDNVLSNIQNPCHKYVTAGTNNITLQATDSNNCRTIITSTVTVNDIPSAAFTNSLACTNNTITFSDSSYINNGSIASWNWNINNTTSGTDPQISYSTAASGLLPVTLIVSSSMGCYDTTTKYIQVNISPVSQFSMSPVITAPGEQVQFTNSSQLANSYFWIFGDGFTDNDSSVQHAYQDTGIYSVALITSTNSGCTDTLFKNHLVLLPKVDIAVMDVSTIEINGLLNIKAVLFNSSNVDVNDFEIVAEIEGMNPIHEFPSFYIPVASAPKTYTFQSNIQLGDETPGYICVEVINPNGLPDADLSNNRKCISSATEFQILSIQPNPVKDNCVLNINMPVKGSASLELTSQSGQTVIQQEFPDLAKGFNSTTLHLGGLNNGVYTLLLLMNDETRVVKIVKL